MRGVGLPGWPCAVTVPTSAKPKPSAGHAGAATARLSKPAASPTGFGKRSPMRVCSSRPPPSGGRARRPSSGAATLSDPSESSWMRSGSMRKRRGRTTAP